MLVCCSQSPWEKLVPPAGTPGGTRFGSAVTGKRAVGCCYIRERRRCGGYLTAMRRTIITLVGVDNGRRRPC